MTDARGFMFNRYGMRVYNKPGDKIQFMKFDSNGEVTHKFTGTFVKAYRKFVVIDTGKYKTTLHINDFAKAKGADFDWIY